MEVGRVVVEEVGRVAEVVLLEKLEGDAAELRRRPVTRLMIS
jgi:hypothetical protein